MKHFCWLFCFFLSASVCQAHSDTLKTESGLRYIVLKDGAGDAVQKGKKVTVHYTGRFADGNVFDSSAGGRPLKIKAGLGEVIPGWDEMLLLMKTGQEVEVFIPAKLAYGAHGVPGPETENNGYRIPPNTDIIFRMRLLDQK